MLQGCFKMCIYRCIVQYIMSRRLSIRFLSTGEIQLCPRGIRTKCPTTMRRLQRQGFRKKGSSTGIRSRRTRSRAGARFWKMDQTSQPISIRANIPDDDRVFCPPCQERKLHGIPGVELVVEGPREKNSDQVRGVENSDDICRVPKVSKHKQPS